jgi:hypothetical protein
VDENGVEWMLTGHATKVVGAQDFTAAVRRVNRPMDTKKGRWRAHERLKVRRS